METNNENLVNEVNRETYDATDLTTRETNLESTASEIVTTKQSKTGRRRILEGRVVSNKADKTIVVLVERYVQHPLYKKYFRRSKKFMAHDEHNECNIGDLVRIVEWRPLSRRKRWMLKEIVERAK